MKAALTGAHGTGKTTLSTKVASLMGSDRKVGHAPEIPRLFIEEIGDKTLFQRGNNSFARQAMIMARQIETEAMLERGLDVLICDRTVLDHWAYTEVLFPHEVSSLEGQAWKRMVGRWVASYDLIYRLPIEFAMENDGVREANENFRVAIDERIVALYTEFGRSVPIIKGPLEARELAFREAIDEVLTATSATAS